MPPSSSELSTANIEHNMLHDGVINYWFHHRPDFLDRPPLIYRRILAEAKTSIEIWDPYFNISTNSPDHKVFEEVKNAVTIRILTSRGLSGARANYLMDVFNAVRTCIPAEKKVSFCVGAIDTHVNGNWGFHDRFLIIDDLVVYIGGASINTTIALYNHAGFIEFKIRSRGGYN